MNILLIVFLFFILLHLILQVSLNVIHVVEPMSNNSSSDYQSYSNDPMMLAQKNAQNIKALQKEVQQIQSMSSEAKKLKNNVDDNTTNIKNILKQQGDAANASSNPPPTSSTKD